MNESSYFAAANTLSEIRPSSLNDGVKLPVDSGQDFRSVEHSVNDYISAAEESIVTELTDGGRKRRALNSQDGNRLSKKKLKVSGSEGDNVDGLRPEGETSSGGGSKATEEKGISEPPKDYIHVRARRGQATDRHSLAERARREKISERMKFLQDLIPGCNKIIRKALVLDEIINYIQSLQHQVEFLSMKLEVVTSDVSSGTKTGMISSGYLNSLPIEDQKIMFDHQHETDDARVLN